MSSVPEITTAKRKPLIHAEAVTLSNDTWQFLHQGERQPASQLIVPTLLPTVDSLSSDFTFPKQELRCLPQAMQQLCSLHLLVTGGLENKQRPDGCWQIQTALIHRWGTCSDNRAFSLLHSNDALFSHFPVLCSHLRHFNSGSNHK